MSLFKRITALAIAVMMLCTLSIGAFAAGSEKRIAVDGSTDNNLTLSNITSEATVADMNVYFATSAVKVTFNTSKDYFKYESYFSDAYLRTDGIVTGEDSGTFIEIEDKSVTLSAKGVYKIKVAKGSEIGTSVYLVISDSATPVIQQIKATTTTAAVMIDNKTVPFTAYNIDGSNYFKLRDLANAINGSKKQFNVSWDGTKNAITIKPTTPYADATEIKSGATNQAVETKIATPTTAALYIGEEEQGLTAYNIDGNNYYMLRDIAGALDFGVSWNGKTNTICIDTSAAYTEE